MVNSDTNKSLSFGSLHLSGTVDIMVWEVVTPAVLSSDTKHHEVHELEDTGNHLSLESENRCSFPLTNN